MPPTTPVDALALLNVHCGIVDGTFEAPAVDDDIAVLQPFADRRIVYCERRFGPDTEVIRLECHEPHQQNRQRGNIPMAAFARRVEPRKLLW